MKTVAIVMALALAGTADQAEGREDTLLPVTVYLQIGMGDARLAPISAQAQGVASGMFAGAGVLINWRSGRPKLHPAEQPILIDITTNTPAAFHRGAMAYAQLFGGAHIRVFYDRVEGRRGPRATIALLAHVLVHEITHVLQDIDRHSEQGVMKARWTDRELMEMAYKPLPFDPEDVLLIHSGLAHRSSNIGRTQAAAH